MMEKFILNDRKIYIPFIGVSSAGKSTIINCIVGYKLFPEALNECTTRGIIIQYSKEEDAELYETEIDSTRNYYVFSEKNKVAQGYKDVRDYLNSLNYKYGNSESKYFYIVKTSIKSFDDFGYDDDLKERILLIDLPGSDTKDNKFNDIIDNERTAYEKLLSISSSFIYINKGRAIKSSENQQILRNLYTKIQDSSKLESDDYLKACFFVINMFSQLSENEMNLIKIKEDISTILFDSPEKHNQINCSIFNAKNFYDFLEESCLLQDHEALIDKLAIKFYNQEESSLEYVDNFPKFCLKNIKIKIKDLGFKLVNSGKCTPEFSEKIKTCIVDKMKILNESLESSDNKSIHQLALIFYYLENELNVKEMHAYKNSFCEGFLNNLKNQIHLSKKYKDEEYVIKLKSILKYFDTFFSKNIKEDKIESNTKKNFKEKRDQLIKDLNNIYNDYKFKFFDLFKIIRGDIDKEINKSKNQVKSSLNSGKKVEEIINEVKSKIRVVLDNFFDNLKKEYTSMNSKIHKLIQQIKEMAIFFNQLQLKKNKKFINSFNQLLNSVKISFGSEKNDSAFVESILKIFRGFYSFLGSLINIFKSQEEKLLKELENFNYEIKESLMFKERAFFINFEDSKINCEDSFQSILGLAFTNLSNIEEKEWNESKKSYHKAKKYLLPDEDFELEENKEEEENEKENKEKNKENNKKEKEGEKEEEKDKKNEENKKD